MLMTQKHTHNGTDHKTGSIHKNAYTYYDILRVTPSSSADDIKQAYLELAKTCHPDLCAGKTTQQKRMAELRFKLITEAYNTLKRKHKIKPIKTLGDLCATNDNTHKQVMAARSVLQETWDNFKEIFWPFAPHNQHAHGKLSQRS